MKYTTSLVLIISVLLFSAFNALSQTATEQIEKLEKELKVTKEDTSKIELLSLLAPLYRKSDLVQHIHICNRGVELSQKVKDTSKILYFLESMSANYSQYGNLDSALMVIAKQKMYLEHYDAPKRLMYVYLGESKILQQKGDYSEATKRLFTSLELAEEIDFKGGVISAYFELGGFYATQKNYKEGIIYTKKALCECEEIDADRVESCKAVAFNNIANFFMYEEKLDSSVYYAEKSIEIKERAGNLRGLVFSYLTIGESYSKLNKPERAEYFFIKSYNAAKEANIKSGVKKATTALANRYVKNGDFKKAKPLIAEMDEFSESLTDVREIQNFYVVMHKYSEGVQDYRNAFKYLKLQANFDDSIRKVENAATIADLETQYETEQYKKESEIADAARVLADERSVYAEDKARQSSYISYLAIGIALLVGFILWFVFNKLKLIRSQKKELDSAYERLAETKENELAAQKLKVLKSQMNPHFIFNSLNSIQNLVLKEDIENSYNYLSNFSNLVRNTLSFSDEEFIPIAKELEFLNIYLKLEKLRFGDEFDYTIDFTGSDELQIPSLVIQPFIENALLHGLFHKEGQKFLSIKFIEGDNFTCEIQDNGIGRTKSAEIKKRQGRSYESFSTASIQKRMTILSEQYNTETKFEYVDLVDENGNSNGTKVVIQMPMLQEEF